MSLLKNKLQKLEDAIQGMVETGETGLTGSTVLRHEIKPKMGEISKGLQNWANWVDKTWPPSSILAFIWFPNNMANSSWWNFFSFMFVSSDISRT